MDQIVNGGYSTCATAPSPATSGTTLVVQSGDGAKFPQTGSFDVVLCAVGQLPLFFGSNKNAEIARASGISTDTITFSSRGAYGTTAQSVAVGWAVDNAVTANLLNQLMAVSTYDPASVAQQVLGTTATQTTTNKRITQRVGSTTSSATPTINTDTYDVYELTALAANITSFTTNLTGTPTDTQDIVIKITDNATARTIAWGTSFEASPGCALPTTTVISTLLTVGFQWNAVTSKWRCVASDASAGGPQLNQLGINATAPTVAGTVASQPPTSATIQTALGNLTLGTAWHNTLSYDVWLTVYIAITVNTSLVVSDGVGTTTTPTQTTIITGTTALGIVAARVKVPAGYYRLLSTSGTATDAIVGQYLEAA